MGWKGWKMRREGVMETYIKDGMERMPVKHGMMTNRIKTTKNKGNIEKSTMDVELVCIKKIH